MNCTGVDENDVRVWQAKISRKDRHIFRWVFAIVEYAIHEPRSVEVFGGQVRNDDVRREFDKM